MPAAQDTRRSPRQIPRSLGGALLCLTLVVGCLLATVPPEALAGEYTVLPCAQGKPSQLRLFTTENEPRFVADDRCQAAGEIILEATNPSGLQSPAEASWEVDQFPLVKGERREIKQISMDLSFSGWDETMPLVWEAWVMGVNHTSELFFTEEIEASHNPLADRDATWIERPGPAASGHFPPGTMSFATTVACRFANCAASGPVTATAKDIEVVLTDKGKPQLEGTVGGTLIGPGTVSGVRTVSIPAKDPLGRVEAPGTTGMFVSQMFIDAPAVDPVPFSKDFASGPNCSLPFKAYKPCPETFTFHHTFDTTELADGPHRAEFIVCDATEDRFSNCFERVRDFVVNNRPRSNELPKISGGELKVATPTPLLADTGRWSALTPLSFATQWLRCPASVSSPEAECAPIAGALANEYTPVKADAGKRLVAQITATLQAAGHSSAKAFSAPSPVVQGNPLDTEGETPRIDPVQTFIEKHPRKRTTGTRSRFSFGSNQASARFQCRFGKGRFRDCVSPLSKRLRPGAHRFQVRAFDALGNPDRTPASFRWRVLAR